MIQALIAKKIPPKMARNGQKSILAIEFKRIKKKRD